MDGPLQSPCPFAVNYPDLENSPFTARCQVVKNQLLDLTGLKGVEVQYAIDRVFYRFAFAHLVIASMRIEVRKKLLIIPCYLRCHYQSVSRPSKPYFLSFLHRETLSIPNTCAAIVLFPPTSSNTHFIYAIS